RDPLSAAREETTERRSCARFLSRTRPPARERSRQVCPCIERWHSPCSGEIAKCPEEDSYVAIRARGASGRCRILALGRGAAPSRERRLTRGSLHRGRHAEGDGGQGRRDARRGEGAGPLGASGWSRGGETEDRLMSRTRKRPGGGPRRR